MRKRPIRKFPQERKGEGGKEASNPESEYLPAGTHRSPFARKGKTLIAKMKGECPDPPHPVRLVLAIAGTEISCSTFGSVGPTRE